MVQSILLLGEKNTKLGSKVDAKASDGKEFPYTKKGMKDYKQYTSMLNKKKKKMGNKGTKKTSGSSYG